MNPEKTAGISALSLDTRNMDTPKPRMAYKPTAAGQVSQSISNRLNIAAGELGISRASFVSMAIEEILNRLEVK
jgi:hypothetical protein